MCGIVAILGARHYDRDSLRRLLVEKCVLLRHRGPDWSGYRVVADGCAIGEW